MRTQLAFSAAGLVLMAACADGGANYQPILDGAATPAYQADLTECQALAAGQNQFDQETMAATALGAGAGAVLGQADSGDALGGTVAGALAGGIASAVNVSERRESIVIECLRGRGHRIVG